MAKASIKGTHANIETIRKWGKKGKKISLIRETENQFDSNAIAVFMHSGIFRSKKKIGYIAAYTAERLAPKFDQGKTATGAITSVYWPLHGGRPKVSIDYFMVQGESK